MIAAEPLLRDPHNRIIDYLRVSITDRCNFRCVYCMPEQGFPASPKADNLTSSEIVRIVRVAAGLGIGKVRLTGGEPLLRKDLPDLVREIAAISGIADLSCTTNGFLLGALAKPLAEAGLHRINVSLDTLRPEAFRSVARRGEIGPVLAGIKAARDAGLTPIKLNCVAMKGFNDEEAPDFARLTLDQDLHVRFIEIMPMRWNLDESSSSDPFSAHQGQGLLQLRRASGDMLDDAQMRRLFVSAAELRSRIEADFGPLEDAQVRTNGPARTYRIPGAIGTIGFISQISADFCERCNRLRLTHDGFLRPCLMSDGELDLRARLRAGAEDSEIAALFRHVVEHKPERHYLASGQKVVGRGMSQIGG